MEKTTKFIIATIGGLIVVGLILLIIGKCASKPIPVEDAVPEEYVEWAKQYHFSTPIDTTDLKPLNVEIFQTLGDGYDGLAHEQSDAHYVRYFGQVIYHLSSKPLYDGMVVKDSMLMLGTYRYVARDSIQKTVPIYATLQTYRRLKENGWIDAILDLQN